MKNIVRMLKYRIKHSYAYYVPKSKGGQCFSIGNSVIVFDVVFSPVILALLE